MTPGMRPYSATGESPAVCGTAALAHEVERICRVLLEAHLEQDEEGLGATVEVSSRVPVPVGETLSLTATVATVGPTKLVCEVLIRHGDANVGRGSFEQHLLPVGELADRIAQRRTVHD